MEENCEVVLQKPLEIEETYPEIIEYVPDNENIWKLIINYGDLGNDLMTIRQVCQQANTASQPHIQFSEERFADFMKKTNSHISFNGNDDFINQIVLLSDQVCDLIDLNKDNEDFRLVIQSWMINVKKSMYDDLSESSTDKLLQGQAQKIITRGKDVQNSYRPSFRRGVKKVGKVIGGTASGLVTVATLPLALVGLPFLLKKKAVGDFLLAPTAITAMVTYSIFKGVTDPNLRNVSTYLALKSAISKIEKKMKEHNIDVE